MLDQWTAEHLQSMLSAGTTQDVNRLNLEYHVPDGWLKPVHASTRHARESYIRAKYIERLFVPREGLSGPRPPARDAPAPGSTVAHSNSIGEIEFVGVLMVHLKSAKDLKRADVIGSSDPYVIFSLGHQTLKSKVVPNNLNPVWNETIMLSWDGTSKLYLQVLDKDSFSSDGK